MIKFYLFILIQGMGNLIMYHEDNLLAKLTFNELVLTLWDQGSIFSVPLVYNQKHATRFTYCFTFFVNIIIGRQQNIQNPERHVVHNQLQFYFLLSVSPVAIYIKVQFAFVLGTLYLPIVSKCFSQGYHYYTLIVFGYKKWLLS